MPTRPEPHQQPAPDDGLAEDSQAEYDIGSSQAGQDMTKEAKRTKRRQAAQKILRASGKVAEEVADIIGPMIP